jgi:hypothetical protein
MIIAGSIVMIVTRGRSVTLRRFLPRFLLIALLVTLSFALVEALYKIVDVFQGFFISPGGVAISQRNLLFIGWDYQPFIGLRALGDANYESAFMSLLLVKLTAFTYYAMVGILLIRKIILWFFIMVSPFFPLLLLFYPLRNTAKIWLGEFFRWLLYAPLFALFLAGLVSVWKLGIPLFFNFSSAGTGVIFPTAVSILLGGPLQKVGVGNSVNLADTFGQYIVALMMLWMVIIFPFILLQIFLDYLSNVNVGNNAFARQLLSIVNKFPPKPPGVPPSLDQPTGLARALPFIRDFAVPGPTTTGLAREIPKDTSIKNNTFVSQKEKEKVVQLVNMQIPTLRDIARFDSSRVSVDKKQSHEREAISVKETLAKLANPAVLTNTSEKERYSKIKESLLHESQSGNVLASSLLSAVKNISNISNTSVTNILNQLANPATITNTSQREKIVSLREQIIKENKNNNSLASSLTIAMNARAGQTVTSDLRSMLTQVLHPEAASQNARQTLQDVRQTLISEKEKGNQLAGTVLSVFEHLKELEKVTSSLLAVAHSQNSETRTIHEKLVSEKEKNNTLASSVLSSLEKLTLATSTNQQEEIITNLKETLVKEKDTALASLLLSQIPSLAQFAPTKADAVVKQLEEAERKGDPLAKQLLRVASETSKETKEEETRKLEEQIQKGDKEGDPLAHLLLGMMTTKSGVATAGTKLPTANRIQEVSLDDYEAVKKMWTENYQNLQTDTNTTDQETKRMSIADDIKQIQETIDLLSSSDEEKIEEGMQHVSDILPFLLIGGFSQSEIVAYLRAKMEAGKIVLSDIDKTKSDEDTKISIETSKTQGQTTSATMSAEVVENLAPVQKVTQVITTQKQPENEQHVVSSAQGVGRGGSSYQASVDMLRLANVTVPNLRSLAQFDEARVSRDVKRLQEGEKISGILSAIARPQKEKDASSVERFLSIQNSLKKEAEKGNVVAESVNRASALTARLSLTEKLQELLSLQKLLKMFLVVDKGDSNNTLQKEMLLGLREKAEHGDVVASSIVGNLTKDMDKLGVILSLYEYLLQARSEGNATAISFLTDLAKLHLVTQEAIDSLLTVLSSNNRGLDTMQQKEIKVEGGVLGQQILALSDEVAKKEFATFVTSLRRIASPLDIADQKDRASFEDMRKRLEKDALAGSAFAMQILTVAKAVVSGSLSPVDKSTMASLLQKQLSLSLAKADPLAKQLSGLIEDALIRETLAVYLGKVLPLILFPEQIVEVGRKALYQKVHDDLLKAKDAGNVFAKTVVEAASVRKQNIGILQALYAKLQEEELKGDSLAKSLRQLLLKEQEGDRLFAVLSILAKLKDTSRILDPEEKEAYKSLQDVLEKQSRGDDVLAMTVLSAAEVVDKEGSSLTEARKVAEALTVHRDGVTGKAVEILLEKETKKYTYAILLRSLLFSLQDLETIGDVSEKDKLKVLMDELHIEAKHGNVVSEEILRSAAMLDRENLAPGEQMDIIIKLYDLLEKNNREGNARAHEILQYLLKKEGEEKLAVFITVLSTIADPERIMQQSEQMIYKKLKADLIIRANRNDPFARFVLSLAQSFASSKLSQGSQTAIVSLLQEKITQEKQNGNAFAHALSALIDKSLPAETISLEGMADMSQKEDPLLSEILSLAKKDDAFSNQEIGVIVLPQENPVQEVSIDDYDAVRLMWTESYRSLEVPLLLGGRKRSRSEWLRDEINQIQSVVDQLLASDPKLRSKGMQAVAYMLPFILIGGFSLSEVIAYLKAKIQAAQTILGEHSGRELEEVIANRMIGKEENILEKEAQH